ncbi:hypothetical protein ACJIZ3_020118 [Penstemon smallii]|uniref:Uncharacterized protein n=1 Tax=Penstemon smallii TaxID=265156 RepID=A0ABD3SHP9_9LAMI
MNRCAIQQNSFATREEIWVSYAAAGNSIEKKETVVCPKPRRVGLIHTALYEPSAIRRHVGHQLEICEAANELLDIIHSKGDCVTDQSITQIASSAPFFSGSPPSRVSNPLIQDLRFGNEKFAPVIPRAIPTPSWLAAPSPTSTTRKAGGSCVWGNFGNKPAVRVEGFNCLDMDSRSCSISTLA